MPPLALPEECRSMGELRDQMDRVDRQLIGMLAQRASYIDGAAELKPGEGLPAGSPTRVEEVVSNVRAGAGEAGFDPDLAEQLWRILIDWSIAREEQVIGVE